MYSLELVHIITTQSIKNGSNLFITRLSQELLLERSKWYQKLWSIKIWCNHWVWV